MDTVRPGAASTAPEWVVQRYTTATPLGLGSREAGVQARAMCRAQARVAGDVRRRARDAGRRPGEKLACSCAARGRLCAVRRDPAAAAGTGPERAGRRCRESPCRAHLVESWGMDGREWEESCCGKCPGCDLRIWPRFWACRRRRPPRAAVGKLRLFAAWDGAAGTPPALLLTSLGGAAAVSP